MEPSDGTGGEVSKPERLIEIENEEDVWKLLEEVSKSGFPEDLRPHIVWKTWPNLEIYLPHTVVEGSISTTMMQPFIELQQSIYRTHSLLSTGSDDLRTLSRAEREQFEIRVKVKEGSSWYQVALEKTLAKLGNDIITKMTGTELVIMVCVLALIYAGKLSYEAYLKHKAEIKKAVSSDETTRQLLQNYQNQLEHDTKRYELLVRAVEARPVLKQVQASADAAKDEFVKAIADESGGSLNGIQLGKDVAIEISSTNRQQGADAKIAGRYLVAKVDTTVDDGFRVTLEDIKTGEQITASLFDAVISEEHKAAIQKAEWSKKSIFVEMTARRLRGRHQNAKIVSVGKEDESAT